MSDPLPSPAAGYGPVPAEVARNLSGLALLRGMIEGRFPAPTICRTMGFIMVDAAEGFAAFEGDTSEALLNSFGTVHGGVACTLLDSAMGCAVHSTLAAGTGFTTLELKVNLVRAVLADTGRIRAEGRVLHPGRRIATAEGRLLDAAGRLLAHGTTTCIIL